MLGTSQVCLCRDMTCGLQFLSQDKVVPIESARKQWRALEAHGYRGAPGREGLPATWGAGGMQIRVCVDFTGDSSVGSGLKCLDSSFCIGPLLLPVVCSGCHSTAPLPQIRSPLLNWTKVTFNSFTGLGHEFTMGVWDHIIEFAAAALEGPLSAS